jgi:hypothetical protein
MKPRKFLLCIDRLDKADGKVWAVKVGSRWFLAHTVHVWVDVVTVFKGAKARQPKAYLEGGGVVRVDGHGTITIAEA